MSEDYYATNIDVWILAVHYKIPLIFISDNKLMENNRNLMVANIPEQYNIENDNNEFYFLKSSAIVINNPPTYTIIVAEDKMKINIENINLDPIKYEIRNNLENKLITFIENFSLTEINKRKVKMNVISKIPAPVTEPVTVPENTLVAEPAPVPETMQPIKKLNKKIKIN